MSGVALGCPRESARLETVRPTLRQGKLAGPGSCCDHGGVVHAVRHSPSAAGANSPGAGVGHDLRGRHGERVATLQAKRRREADVRGARLPHPAGSVCGRGIAFAWAELEPGAQVVTPGGRPGAGRRHDCSGRPRAPSQWTAAVADAVRSAREVGVSGRWKRPRTDGSTGAALDRRPRAAYHRRWFRVRPSRTRRSQRGASSDDSLRRVPFAMSGRRTLLRAVSWRP